MSLKTILFIIAIIFFLQGTFFVLFKVKGSEICDDEKNDDNPKEVFKVQGKLFIFNFIFWGVIILLIRFFLH